MEAINRFATWARSKLGIRRSLRLSGRTRNGTTTDLEGVPDDSNTLWQAKATEGRADPMYVAVPA
jgi:hypothetical protein